MTDSDAEDLVTDRVEHGAGPDRHFGEEGARLTYGSYLRVDELLDQQHLESDPPAHDELLFITVHQVYELWFQQLLHELDGRARRDVRGRPVVGAAPAGAGACRSRAS